MAQIDQVFFENNSLAIEQINRCNWSILTQFFYNTEIHLLGISRKQGEEYVLAFLEVLLEYFAQIHNAKNTTNNPFMIGQIAQTILFDFSYMLNFADICFILKSGVSGYYRHKEQFTKEEFDLPSVMRWVKIFLEEKNKKISEISQKRENEEKECNRKNPDGSYVYALDYEYLKKKAQEDHKRKFKIEN